MVKVMWRWVQSDVNLSPFRFPCCAGNLQGKIDIFEANLGISSQYSQQFCRIHDYIPYSTEQGIIWSEQGEFEVHQGKIL